MKRPFAGAIKRKGRSKAVKRKPGAGIAFMPPTGDKAVDDHVGALQRAAIQRILKAVGEKPDDENILARDIYEAYLEFAESSDVRDQTAEKNRKLVKRIRVGMEKYVKLMEAHDLIRSTAQSHDLRPLLKGLQNFEKWQKNWRCRVFKNMQKIKGRRPNPNEWLAGVSLRLVFENRFKSCATWSRNAEDKPDGLLIRFVKATMAELGIPYGEETIARALTRLAFLRDDPSAHIALGADQKP